MDVLPRRPLKALTVFVVQKSDELCRYFFLGTMPYEVDVVRSRGFRVPQRHPLRKNCISPQLIMDAITTERRFCVEETEFRRRVNVKKLVQRE